jgi:ribosome maturation factor RimP
VKRVEDITRSIVMPFLEENGCRLWDVVFEKEGAMYYLKILFDTHDGSLDMEKCEKLTPPLNKLIDAQEFMQKGQVDILEIGSPGITRRLRHKEHFERCTGEKIKVMRRLDNGKTESVTGILQNYNEENKSVTVDGEEMSMKKCIRITLEDIPQ